MDSAPIRVLLVDDEALARGTLRLLLRDDPEVEVIGEAMNGADAASMMRALAPDLVFLDIQMSKGTGLQALRELDAQERPVVVFVTAFDEHALTAFEVDAIDYILKPFDDERFARALQRAKAHVRMRRAHALAQQLVAALGGAPASARGTSPPPPSAPGGRYLERVAIKEAGRVVFLPVHDVDWIEAEDYYIELHAGGRTHLLRESMRKMEAQLDPQKFARVHRSAIVNVERVKELRSLSNGEYAVVLVDGTELKLSRSRRDALCGLLGVG